MAVNQMLPDVILPRQKGFTLIELVMGIVVFGIVLAIIATLIAPTTRGSFDPFWQTRATELSESLFNEISAKSFDEQSDRSGGMIRCSEAGATLCTQSGSLGPDLGETRDSFDDVDDFHGLVLTDANIGDAQGNSPVVAGSAMYQGFVAEVTVFYDDDLDGINDDTPVLGTYIGDTKLITIRITTPGRDAIVSSFVRKNF